MKLDTYIITHADLVPGRGHVYVAREAVAGGADVIQFREKNYATGEMIRVATTLQKICRQAGTTFIVNDRVDVALAMDADGVHVGQEDMPASIARRLIGPNKILGVSAGSLEAALKAEADGADYLGVGMIFQAGVKAGIRTAKGLDIIRQIVQAVKIPVVAIGGIGHANAASCIEAGATGCAVITAVVAAPSVKEATVDLAKIIREAKARQAG